MRAEIGKCVLDQESKYLDDEEDEDEENEKQKMQRLAKQLQQSYGVKLFETSALLGSGLNDVFQHIAEQMLSM